MAATRQDLWRAVDTRETAAFDPDGAPLIGILLPAMSRRRVGTDPRTGKDVFRDPEVVVIDDYVQAGGGTVVYDQDRFMASRRWHFFYIPQATPIPPELTVTEAEYNIFFDANLHRIEVKKPIPVPAYRGALDNLARAAFAKRYRDARTFTGPGR